MTKIPPKPKKKDQNFPKTQKMTKIPPKPKNDQNNSKTKKMTKIPLKPKKKAKIPQKPNK